MIDSLKRDRDGHSCNVAVSGIVELGRVHVAMPFDESGSIWRVSHGLQVHRRLCGTSPQSSCDLDTRYLVMRAASGRNGRMKDHRVVGVQEQWTPHARLKLQKQNAV
jgi:hypothetical protein